MEPNLSDDALQHSTFDGVADYIAALDTVCSSAQRTLNIFEQNFEDIGFNSEARFDILHRFLLSSTISRLNLLAHDPQHLIRYCPRMMMLLRQFGSSMFIYQTPKTLLHITEPFAVADNSNYVRRFHFDDTRGLLAKNDPEEARRLNSRFNEMWTASHPCTSGTTLGL
jgi:hypothetical protein